MSQCCVLFFVHDGIVVYTFMSPVRTEILINNIVAWDIVLPPLLISCFSVFNSFFDHFYFPSYVLKYNALRLGDKFGPHLQAYFFHNKCQYMIIFAVIKPGLTSY